MKEEEIKKLIDKYNLLLDNENYEDLESAFDEALFTQKKEILKQFNHWYKNETETIEDAIERILK